MICEKCGKEFSEDWRKDKDTIRKNPTPRFCSKKCSNSRKFSEESRKKTSKSLKLWAKENPEAVKANGNKNRIYLIEANKAWQEKRQMILLESDFEHLSFDLKRKRILLEQNGKCAHCELSEWMGKPIILEIDHKDGNNQNDSRDNLEAICPNCHSLTPTWRGRNKEQKTKNRISDDDIFNALIETRNIHQCLIKVGLSPKGGNYGRVKKMLTMRNIDYSAVPIEKAE